ncbi:MAG: ribbon-helix-helix domain-containing protein [Microcoleus sp.]
MSITLTKTQEIFIQTKLQTGKYGSAEEVLEVALRLLDEYDRADRQWSDAVRVKIDAAVAMSEHTPPIDGETFIAGICDRFRQARESKQGYTN